MTRFPQFVITMIRYIRTYVRTLTYVVVLLEQRRLKDTLRCAINSGCILTVIV